MIRELRIWLAEQLTPEGCKVWRTSPRKVFARETAREMLWQGYSRREVVQVVPLDRRAVREIDEGIDEYVEEAGDEG